ncbi:hypothetical protein F5Y16DRAFT_401493 [Xylariaceae sp. FL0255]|nr:hypothetical protein F5Y16DRAFT_401493 [Xylariaceae sp. FL0255]
MTRTQHTSIINRNPIFIIFYLVYNGHITFTLITKPSYNEAMKPLAPTPTLVPLPIVAILLLPTFVSGAAVVVNNKRAIPYCCTVGCGSCADSCDNGGFVFAPFYTYYAVDSPINSDDDDGAPEYYNNKMEKVTMLSPSEIGDFISSSSPSEIKIS